jgi:hypothetical protein
MSQEISYHLQIPGKTFLVGEYLALAGGPSVVALTRPCFEFSWTPVNHPLNHGFHPESPAGLLLNKLRVKRPDSSKYAVSFQDPHFGKGGLGASTAEFIGSWVFEQWLTSETFNERVRTNKRTEFVEILPNHLNEVVPLWSSDRVGSGRFRDLLDRYFAHVKVGSGADLVSQVTGGIAVWDGAQDHMRRFAWPFSDLSMSLFKTGRKLATHEHLASSVESQRHAGHESVRERGLGSRRETGFDPGFDSGFESDMREWLKEAIQSLATSDADRFSASVRGTGRLLAASGRLATHSQSILEQLSDVSQVRAAKGCGAMGSDVILVLHDPGERSAQFLKQFADENGLSFAGSEMDLYSDGLVLETKGSPA